MTRCTGGKKVGGRQHNETLGTDLVHGNRRSIAGLTHLRIAKSQYKHSWEAIATSPKAHTRRSPGVLCQKDGFLPH